MAQHIMIDLETLSTAPDAGIIQIGAQVFDPTADDEGVLIGDGICLNVDPQAVMDAGMRIEWPTLYWWMRQPDAFATLAEPGEGFLLSKSLVELSAFVKANGGSWAKIWANGASFDPPVLEMSYRRCRLDVPWSYNNVLDMRTMKWLAPSVARVEPELAHNALSDCRAQAIYVARCYRALKGSPAGEEGRQETRAAAVEKVSETVGGEKSELLLFYEKLERHDWWYMMSDDGSVYERGEKADRELRREAASSGEKAQLHKAYSEFKAGKGPKPEQPA
jgi:exodeoxyribonuclease VIII